MTKVEVPPDCMSISLSRLQNGFERTIVLETSSLRIELADWRVMREQFLCSGRLY